MTLTVDDAVDQVFDSMNFETLIGWANILNVTHDEDTWLDDEWPDKEGELRVQIAAAMIKKLERHNDFQPHEEYKRRVLGNFVAQTESGPD